MADQRVAGLIQLKVDGEIRKAKGSFTYNAGEPKRETIPGADGVHGYKETAQAPFIEGAITDTQDLSISALARGKDLTISLKLGNGKTFMLGEAWFAGDGNATTEEGEIAVRWEGISGVEVR